MPTGLTSRMWWGDLLDGASQLADALVDVAPLWREAAAGAARHWPLLLALLLPAVGLSAAMRVWGEPALHAGLSHRWKGHPLGVSLPALMAVAMHGVATWLVASLLMQAFIWAAHPEAAVRATVRIVVAVVTSMVVVTAVGRGILRLLATRHPALLGTAPLRPVAYWLAGSLMLVALADNFAVAAGASSMTARALAQTFAAACLVLTMIFGLLRLASALRGSSADALDVAERRMLQLLRAGLSLGWSWVIGIVICLLTGYAALAAFLAKQAVWSILVLALLYLFFRVVRDATDLVVGRREGLLHWSRRLGLGARRLQQAAVVCSGAIMLAIICVAVMLLSAPYGLGAGDVLGRVIDTGGRLRIGGLSFSPMQILRALLVAVVTIAAARLLARWLACRLLPTTRLDGGVQASLTTLVGYAGVVLGIGLGLAALGVEPNRITWVVSALTVGIGFGLQAIVQNFISGLILLVERPVKVGDWVVVGDAEGDVRRINVRATEIALADRTIVLVPNSELITKAVRNRTFAATDGLVKILLPVPAAADARQAIGIVDSVVHGHPGLRTTPPPSVQLEDVKDNKIWIGVSAYVDSPRQVTRMRAELLYALVQQLQAHGVALA